MQTLNLGILAHVDAGKTTLTERLLYGAGVIEKLGSVNDGTTQTDSGDIERQRGITIRTAVVSFRVGDLQVNLIDTPGHPDFIAEVERALTVLDGAILVLSAVEGVQAQSRVLMKSLRKLRLPTLIFVNKIDRVGARTDALLRDVRAKLAPQVIAMNSVRDPGTPAASTVVRPDDEPALQAELAELLADCDDALMAQLMERPVPSPPDLWVLLSAKIDTGVVNPVFFGSALTGRGTDELTQGIRRYLHPRPADAIELRGTVFAIERAQGEEKVAYLRLFSGELRDRQHVRFERAEPGGRISAFSGKVTGLEIVGGRTHSSLRAQAPPTLTQGNVGKLRGLPQIRVGDQLGKLDTSALQAQFAPPSLETVIRARHPNQEAELHAALTSFAEEDPLIRTRPSGGGATAVLLYGDVQREVIAARLEGDFGIEATFEPAQPVYFERPVGVGAATRAFNRLGPERFWATIGLRVEPAAIGEGVSFTNRVESGSVPLAFQRAVEATVLTTLGQGLCGWEVTDCAVTLTDLGYSAPVSTAADFRDLTPLILMAALRDSGTRTYEPCHSFEIEAPFDVVGDLIRFLATLEADITESNETGPSTWLVGGEIPARLVRQVTTALPGLTHGEGALWSRPGRDRPTRQAPHRPRVDGNPLDYDAYIKHLAKRRLNPGAAPRNGRDPRPP